MRSLTCIVSSCSDPARGYARAATCFLLFLAFLLAAQPQPVFAQDGTAMYTVTFQGNWNTSSVPGASVPGSAHFTTLIGAVHNSSITFWKRDGTATAGVEQVAETGVTGLFSSEISAAGDNVRSRVMGSSGRVSPEGTETLKIELSSSHPLFTFMTMLGPSPDWFVGVSSYSLMDESGSWRASHSVDLFAYDAGTAEGDTFALSNLDTSPRATITSIRGKAPFSQTVPVARLRFELTSAPPPPSGGTDMTTDNQTQQPTTQTQQPAERTPAPSSGGGGGCAVAGSGTGGSPGALPAAAVLLLAVSFGRRLFGSR